MWFILISLLYFANANGHLIPPDDTPDVDPSPWGVSDLKEREYEGKIRNQDTITVVDDVLLVENFGKYLMMRTTLNATTTQTDPGRQYNALFTVLVALAKAISSSCSYFEQTFDQLYDPTITTYFVYGLNRADKVPQMIEDYIDRGTARIPKIKKLIEDICEGDVTRSSCAEDIDNTIKATPLFYVKELETLEALAHLARNFQEYEEEFDRAAQKLTMYYYLKASKERLKHYVLHLVNSIDHLTDKPIKCS